MEQLLENDNSVSIHHRNIQTLATEMYKVTTGLSPEIMNEIFQIRQETCYRKLYGKVQVRDDSCTGIF